MVARTTLLLVMFIHCSKATCPWQDALLQWKKLDVFSRLAKRRLSDRKNQHLQDFREITSSFLRGNHEEIVSPLQKLHQFESPVANR